MSHLEFLATVPTVEIPRPRSVPAQALLRLRDMITRDATAQQFVANSSAEGALLSWLWALGDAVYVSTEVMKDDTERKGVAARMRLKAAQVFMKMNLRTVKEKPEHNSSASSGVTTDAAAPGPHPARLSIATYESDERPEPATSLWAESTALMEAEAKRRTFLFSPTGEAELRAVIARMRQLPASALHPLLASRSPCKHMVYLSTAVRTTGPPPPACLPFAAPFVIILHHRWITALPGDGAIMNVHG